jgi:hypothetical protein
MEVNDQLHIPAASPPAEETGRRLVGPPQLVWTRWRREKISSLLLPGIELRYFKIAF